MITRHAAIDITVLYYAIILMNTFVDNKSVAITKEIAVHVHKVRDFLTRHMKRTALMNN